jgi:Mpv17 / PMP22 family
MMSKFIRLRLRERSNRSSEGSVWSKVSFLFRLILCVGMLPMIFPESEALVTNLRLPKSTTVLYMPLTPHHVGTTTDLWRGGVVVHGARISFPLYRLPGKSTTTAARNVERIRNLYNDKDCRTRGSHIERQTMGLLSWLLVVLGSCFLWLRYHRCRLALSLGFLMAHFAFEEGAFWSDFSAVEVLRKLGAWYMAHLSANPIVTKSISAGVIGTIGDYTAQWLEHILPSRHRSEKEISCSELAIESQSLLQRSLSIHGRYHFRRGISMLADGIFISGPLMHLGYEVFEKILPIADASNGPASALAAMIHVAADSIILDSFFVASRFFTTGLMEGISMEELLPQFKSVYLPSLKASWATSVVMCPVQFSCFRYLPLSFRVLSVNCIDVIWDAVLSFMAHRNR